MGKKEIEDSLLRSGWPKEFVTNYLRSAFRSFKGEISVQGVYKKFAKPVLEDVSLVIPSGKVFGIAGPSGSGKSTLLNMLIGFLQPDKGRITIHKNGKHLDVRNATQFFGLSTQTPSVYDMLTVDENLLHFASLYQLTLSEARKRAEKLARLVGLHASRNVLAKELSGGMLKRLDIACALINNPYILVLDEPTSGLDDHLRRGLWELIKEINRKGTTVIVASHFVAEMAVLANDMCYIQNGKVTMMDANARFKVLIQTKDGTYTGLRGGKKQQSAYVIFTQKPLDVIKNINIPPEKLAILDVEPSLQ